MKGMNMMDGMNKLQTKFIEFAEKLNVEGETIEKIQNEFLKMNSEAPKDGVMVRKVEVKVKPEGRQIDRLNKGEERMPSMEEISEMSKEELIPLIQRFFSKYKKEEIDDEITPSTPLAMMVRRNQGY